jgi:hypothetical protein
MFMASAAPFMTSRLKRLVKAFTKRFRGNAPVQQIEKRLEYLRPDPAVIVTDGSDLRTS